MLDLNLNYYKKFFPKRKPSELYRFTKVCQEKKIRNYDLFLRINCQKITIERVL